MRAGWGPSTTTWACRWACSRGPPAPSTAARPSPPTPRAAPPPPLTFPAPPHDDPELSLEMARVVKQLDAADFEISERDRTISLTEIGEDHGERVVGQPLSGPGRPGS